MSALKSMRLVEISAIGALGGIAGGLAEIVWIVLYGAATGTSTDVVARGIVRAVLPALAMSPWSVWLGILIHLGLAIFLGLGLVLALRLSSRRPDLAYSEFGLVVPALLAVWGMNFLIALPQIDPAFVRLLPYSVTLVSKLLFGLSAAAVFRAHRLRLASISNG